MLCISRGLRMIEPYFAYIQVCDSCGKSIDKEQHIEKGQQEVPKRFLGQYGSRGVHTTTL